MKPFSHILVLLIPILAFPPLLGAQEAPPPQWGEVELARSRSCVGRLARVDSLNSVLAPIAQRLSRLDSLGRAVSLEKPEDAAPFDSSDPVEAAVARWFAADSTLAARYLATSDSSILAERQTARTAILDQIRGTIQELVADGQGQAREGAPIQAEAQSCEGAILVRSAVLEVCDTTDSPVCEAAAEEDPQGIVRFVNSPEDLWDVEEYRPWTQPAPIQPSPDGGLTGARTAARARRGNVVFSVALAPILLNRAELSDEQIREAEANLDSLGFTFDHPLFVMAPGLEFQAELPAPVGGETHYLLHFGDLTGDDVIWSMEAGQGGPVQVSFPASEQDLARLQAGEPVSLTAVKAPQDAEETGSTAEPVFTLTLLQVGEATNVATLLQYMAGGGLSQDLNALAQPGSGG